MDSSRKQLAEHDRTRLETGEITWGLRRLDLAVYACSLVLRDKLNSSFTFAVGQDQKFEIMGANCFADAMIDLGCLSTRKLLAFFGLGLDAKTGLLKSVDSLDQRDIYVCDWPKGTLLSVERATKIPESEFTASKVQQCWGTILKLANKSVAHLTQDTIGQNKMIIQEVEIGFSAVRTLVNEAFYRTVLEREPPKSWLPSSF